MVLNLGRCHFMCLGLSTVNETFVYDKIEMKNSKEEIILGVIIDNKLRFKKHIKKLFKTFIKSQSRYCPLVWMFYSRQTNNMINKIYERALRSVLTDNVSDFETMRLNMNDITIANSYD